MPNKQGWPGLMWRRQDGRLCQTIFHWYNVHAHYDTFKPPSLTPIFLSTAVNLIGKGMNTWPCNFCTLQQLTDCELWTLYTIYSSSIGVRTERRDCPIALPGLALAWHLDPDVGEQGQQIFQVWWMAAAVGSPNPSKHRTSSSGSSKTNRTESQPSLTWQAQAP